MVEVGREGVMSKGGSVENCAGRLDGSYKLARRMEDVIQKHVHSNTAELGRRTARRRSIRFVLWLQPHYDEVIMYPIADLIRAQRRHSTSRQLQRAQHPTTPSQTRKARQLPGLMRTLAASKVLAETAMEHAV